MRRDEMLKEIDSTVRTLENMGLDLTKGWEQIKKRLPKRVPLRHLETLNFLLWQFALVEKERLDRASEAHPVPEGGQDVSKLSTREYIIWSSGARAGKAGVLRSLAGSAIWFTLEDDLQRKKEN